MSIELVMPSNHLLLCLSPSPSPSNFPSIRVFSNESVLHMRWPKYWSSNFNISPSNEYSRLISFRMDWLDLLAVQETLKSLLQHCSSKVSIPQLSAFFMVQLSHLSMTTERSIALIRWTFVHKVMSLLFIMLSRLVIAFLPKSKHLIITWLQSSSAVILEPEKIESAAVSIVSPSIFHEVMGPDAIIFIFWMLSFKPVFFTLLFYLQQEAPQFLFTFCHKGGGTCRSEIIDISPVILIPACAASSPAFCMMYSAYKLNKHMGIYSLD